MRAPSIFGHGKLMTVLGLVGCVAAATWLYDQYHFSVQWPRNIQQEVLGTTIATDDSLISKERHFSQFGEGFARWRYKADASASDLKRLCGEADVATCTFIRSRKVKDGVDVSVSFSRGVLTIEEVWS